MIRDGALEGVDAIFGLHLWQPLANGQVGLVAGPMMAEPDTFELTVTGRGGHAAMPQQTVDPILAAAQTVVNVQSIVSRNRAPLTPLVVSFGSIHGGTADNIIPDEVVLTGTVRTLDDATQELAERRLREIVTATAATFGATAALTYTRGYPPLVNDPALVELARAVATRTLGAGRVTDIQPVMGGEDFAYYLQRVPGVFVFLGTGSRPYPHHHPRFDIDESLLPDAALLMTALALEFLARPTAHS
jgi:amidohydrolase